MSSLSHISKKFPPSFPLTAVLEARFSSSVSSCSNDTIPHFIVTDTSWITAFCFFVFFKSSVFLMRQRSWVCACVQLCRRWSCVKKRMYSLNHWDKFSLKKKKSNLYFLNNDIIKLSIKKKNQSGSQVNAIHFGTCMSLPPACFVSPFRTAGQGDNLSPF